MSNEIAIDKLRAWIGKQESATDVITPELIARFKATLAGFIELLPDSAAQVPLGIHWCLSPPAVQRDALGADGHPLTGGFLPPIPLPRRMWASSRVAFHNVPRIGEPITRTSTVADIRLKQGATSGAMILVNLDHIYVQKTGRTLETLIEEQQTIIYRQASSFRKAQPEQENSASCSREIIPDNTLLFRYSALTFNGHRIHYDQDYATREEGYPGLVVHGPLMATLLMHLAQANRADQTLREFEFRGLAPAFVNQALHLNVLDNKAQALEVRNSNAAIIMKAGAHF